MKFLNYFQLALSILIFVCSTILIAKNVAMGALGLWGIPFCLSFFVFTLLLVLFAWGEVKSYDDNEKTLKR